MAPASVIELSQPLSQDASSTAHVLLKESADVELRIKSATNPEQPTSEATQFTVTATECTWNLYATAKLPKSTQVSNRAKLVDTTSDEQVVRIGNAIFVPQWGSFPAPLRPFTPSKFSLYIDSIEQHGQHLFVTSRQHVTEVPDLKDEPAKDADAKLKDKKSETDGVKKGIEATENTPAAPENGMTKSKSGEDKDDSSDDDEAYKIPKPDSDDSSNELSADESWSEGSTEYDSDQKIADFRPVPPRIERVRNISDSESSSGPEDEESSASEDSEDENGLLEGEDKDERGRAMDTDEESDMYEAMFVNDRIDPGTDEDDRNSAAGFDSDDLPDWDEWSDGDGFQAAGSDSEECSECGEDGGACALPPKRDSMPTQSTGNDEDLEKPVGSPVAQIYIYDPARSARNTTETEDSRLSPPRIFHFKRTTKQILASSPPAIHPTKSLLVWPLGDNRILFADYLSNTYFVRKFQTSQFWSSHVSVNCRFSQDGKYLHVVAVEKSGRPPMIPARVKKGKKHPDAKKDGKEKPKEERPKYEVIVSTYRLSETKITRVPPILIGRVQKNVAELGVLPTVSWNGSHVYVSLAKKSVCQIYRVDLGYPSASKSKRSKQGEMTMQRLTIHLPEWVAGRELRYLPNGDSTDDGKPIVAAELTKIPPYKPAQKDSEKQDTEETSKAAPAPNSTSATTSILAKPEANTSTNDSSSSSVKEDAVQTNILKTLEPRSTQNGSEHVEASIEATVNATTTEATEKEISKSSTSTTSTDTPASESTKPEPNPHPTTMISTLSSELVKSLGGWRDILAGADDDAIASNDLPNGTVDKKDINVLSFQTVMS